MRRRILFRITVNTLILILLFACAEAKELPATNAWSLELNKGGCLDICESYTIDILHDGTYHYKGNHNVVHLGKRSGEFGTDELSKIKELIDSIDWNTMKSTYGSAAEDSQQKELTYTSNALTKRITIYRLEPIELRALERYIDQIIRKDDF